MGTSKKTPDRRAAAGGDEQRVITVGPHHVRVSISGRQFQGLPLLLCNGVGAEATLWDQFRASVQRPTLAFDVRRGHLGRRPSLHTYAAFLREVLTQLELETVDVLGLSWGGMAAQQLAHDYPSAVRRLVLASTTPGFLSVPAKPSSTVALLSPARDAERMDDVITKVYGGDFLENPGLARELGLVRSIHEPTYRKQLLAVVGWTSVPWLRSLRHETLILHGDNDPMVPVVNSRLMCWLIPRARRVVVPGGGHLFLFTRPEEFGRTVTDFLAEDDVQADPRKSAGRAGGM